MMTLLTLGSTSSYVSVIDPCFETKVFESFYLLLFNEHYTKTITVKTKSND